jgi:8-oxo-dGTP pyrophosphatase MutT (NUDIX family)
LLTLTTIFRDSDAKTLCTTTERQAVRGIVIRGSKLLLFYTPVGREYKFPGGGVDYGETLETALHARFLKNAVRV